MENHVNLFYNLQFTTVGNRVQNMIPSKASGTASKTVSSHLWM